MPKSVSVTTISLTHSLSHSLTHSLSHSLTHSLTHSLSHSLSHSLTHSHARSLVHSPIQSPTDAATQSLTHPLNHSLTLTFTPSGIVIGRHTRAHERARRSTRAHSFHINTLVNGQERRRQKQTDRKRHRDASFQETISRVASMNVLQLIQHSKNMVEKLTSKKDTFSRCAQGTFPLEMVT